ncbi:tyrosyl-DNA phosphodiesterase 2 isoform X2 [Ailuropoda melanoleuca]|uniref:tyrosyl-DNA phosphodiesterase 2 isoform X2 n=1 Tax=Ailuropoda melanoleuca TaxID=9646 RepID=UPI0014945FA8|nr:tyrosyl-DNA phosphodiesterase 2 isoform X2 [Ailuropoda melanoleuca]
MERPRDLEAERAEGEPEVKKQRLLCVEFASVARCDSAVAQCYLAENDWEMERALNSYFEPPGQESAAESRPQTAAAGPESWSPNVVVYPATFWMSGSSWANLSIASIHGIHK